VEYIYLGDRLTDPLFKDARCRAVRDDRGKCRRGRNGTMLVEFDGAGKQVVLARRLRKLQEPIESPWLR
jgi:hypothetical protein